MNDDYFRYMHIPSALGHAFMDVFTRVEHALKASGTYADGGAESVSPAWDRFANHIDAALRAIQDNDLQAALHSLLSDPVRKQAKTGFIPLPLDFKQTETQRAFHVIRAVRNNIVHGAKIQMEGEKEHGRNENLVFASLTVLKHASGLVESVRAKFEETAPRT
jgi:hypothetical protein